MLLIILYTTKYVKYIYYMYYFKFFCAVALNVTPDLKFLPLCIHHFLLRDARKVSILRSPH